MEVKTTTCLLPLQVILLLIVVTQEAGSVGNAIFGDKFALPFWCYADESCDESTWVEECMEGSHQSPIDLPSNYKTIHGHHEQVDDFPKHSLTFPSFELDFRGHSVQVKPGGDPFYFTRKLGNGEHVKYRLHGLDFHWGSRMDTGAEHTIGGLAYEGEVHLMFYDETQFNPEEDDDFPTYNGDRDFLVIAVFLDQEHLGWKPTTHLLSPIARRLGNLTKDDPILVEEPLSLTELFRGSVAYRYPGSFTTPSCRELEWWVIRKPIVVPKWHMKAFRNAHVDGEPVESDNFRRKKGKEPADISLIKLNYATPPESD